MIDHQQISLRSIQPSDAGMILEWENDPLNWFVSNTKSNYSLSEMIELIDSLEDIEVAKQARFIIIDKSSGAPFGAVDLFFINFDEESASIGILIANSRNRMKGYAFEALKCLQEVCNEELGIYNLTATVHESNKASVRLFEKANFSKKKLTQDAQLDNADYIETLIFEKCLKR